LIILFIEYPVQVIAKSTMSEHPENGKSVADKTIPIPERKNRASDKKSDLNFLQTTSQLKNDEPARLTSSNFKSTRSENRIVLATELTPDDWKQVFENCNLRYGIKMDMKRLHRAHKPLFQFKTDKKVVFHLNDGSSTAAYLRTKEMDSSFVSSDFFDGEIGCSCPYVGIGVSADYLNSEAATNVNRKTYVTYCYNFPRADLFIDTSDLEPTNEFIEAIDSVLSMSTLNQQISQLEKVLSEYGHVYPSSVVLGGHLYHTEEYENKEKAEEARNRIAADASFSPSFLRGLKIGGGGGEHEERSQNKSSERSTSFTYTAVGGDTLRVHDTVCWAASVAEPRLWRVIQQDEYRSVIELVDEERQTKLRKVHDHFLSKNPHLSKYFSMILNSTFSHCIEIMQIFIKTLYWKNDSFESSTK